MANQLNLVDEVCSTYKNMDSSEYESESDFDNSLVDSNYGPSDQSFQSLASDSSAEIDDDILPAGNSGNFEIVDDFQPVQSESESQWTEYVARHESFDFNGIVVCSYYFFFLCLDIFLISVKVRA